MSSTFEAVRAKLLADGTVAGLVVDRVYANVMTQGEPTPAVVCSLITEVPQNSLTGYPEDRLVNALLQVDCYAERYKAAHELAAAVDAVLADLRGPELNAWLEVKRDLYDNETQLHRVSMDFSIWR